MNITFERFPALRLLYSDQRNYPEILPFICTDAHHQAFLNESTVLYELFQGFIHPDNRDGLAEDAAENTVVYNYVVSPNLFDKFKYKRRLNASNFTSYLAKDHECYGGIVVADMEEGLHYVYHMITLNQDKKDLESQAVYYKIGYFKNSTFLGFEEGYVDQEDKVSTISGIYDGDYTIGDYLYFIGALFRHIERFKMIRPMPADLKIKDGHFEYVMMDEFDEGINEKGPDLVARPVN